MGMAAPRNGMRYTHVVGLLTAGCLAVVSGVWQDYWMAVWFGYFAFINYQMLQALHYAYTSADDGEWRGR
jgi:stage IV sporulation protein FB